MRPSPTKHVFIFEQNNFRKMKKISLMMLLWVLSAATLLAQALPRQTKLDSLFVLLENHHKFMGSVALMRDGVITFSNTYGLADVESKVPAGPNTVYRIGSVTKTFTAVMVLQMAEQGKLSVDDKLAKYFPGIEGSEKISLADMLRHRSGLFSLTSDSTYMAFHTTAQTRKALLDRMLQYKLQFEPDAKLEYSNTNYILLGWILEDLSRKSYAQLLREKIVLPLGLKHTFATKPEHGFAATSYNWDGKQWLAESFTDMSVPGGAGNIYSTPEDLLQFYHALFSGKLLSDASLKLMTELRDMFGFGLFNMPFFEHKGLGHTGGIDGFRSVAVYYPEEKVGAAVCANALNYNHNDILIAILSEAFGKDWKLPDINEAKVDVAILASYAGTYAAEGFPLKLTIRQREGKLYGQGTGQPEFPLEARSEDTFVFDNAGLSITFKDGKLHLKQGAIKLEMSKEE